MANLSGVLMDSFPVLDVAAAQVNHRVMGGGGGVYGSLNYFVFKLVPNSFIEIITTRQNRKSKILNATFNDI